MMRFNIEYQEIYEYINSIFKINKLIIKTSLRSGIELIAQSKKIIDELEYKI